MGEENGLATYQIGEYQILLQTEDIDHSDERDAMRGASDSRPAKDFQAAIDATIPAAEALIGSLKRVEGPEEVEVDFGIKFGAKTGAFIASVDSEATFKVRLKWKRTT